MISIEFNQLPGELSKKICETASWWGDINLVEDIYTRTLKHYDRNGSNDILYTPISDRKFRDRDSWTKELLDSVFELYAGADDIAYEIMMEYMNDWKRFVVNSIAKGRSWNVLSRRDIWLITYTWTDGWSKRCYNRMEDCDIIVKMVNMPKSLPAVIRDTDYTMIICVDDLEETLINDDYNMLLGARIIELTGGYNIIAVAEVYA